MQLCKTMFGVLMLKGKGKSFPAGCKLTCPKGGAAVCVVETLAVLPASFAGI